ncbi:MAG TPA: hypothetical protein VFN49_07065 [Candidatus Aquilonibacter sp.]|nr:hypothetical protein [Candidatus Aquilonibacter sp.]
MNVLAVDGGSSTLKVAAYAMPDERKLAERTVSIADQGTSLASFLDELSAQGTRIDATGHRIVFGGRQHVRPERVTPLLLDRLEQLVPFDPLHLRAELDAVRFTHNQLPNIPHVVCFDTAFHQRMPSIAKRYPLGDEFAGVERFGYHGLSLEYIVSVLGASGRTIVAHLGSGASVSAIRDGAPVDTSMGLTPLGGIMMGTRPGDLDPGVLLYAASELGLSREALREALTYRSGLFGVSGGTSDMAALLAREAEDPRAREAIGLFVYIAAKHIGALAATLGGLDTLVFTAGIGENSAVIRERIGERLGFLEPFEVRVIPANEALAICRHVVTVVQSTDT